MCFALVQEKAADGGSDFVKVRDYHHQNHQQDQSNRQAALSTLSMETSEPQTRGGWARAYVRFEPQELARLVVV